MSDLIPVIVDDGDPTHTHPAVIRSSNTAGRTKVVSDEDGHTSVVEDDSTPGASYTPLTVRLPGGGEIEAHAEIKRCFNENWRWLLDSQPGRKRALDNIYRAKEPTGERSYVLGLAADTEKESDRNPGLPALFEPDDLHVVFAALPPVMAKQVDAEAVALLYIPTPYRLDSGAVIASLLPRTLKAYRLYGTVDSAQDDLERVRAALRARLFEGRDPFVPDAFPSIGEKDEVESTEDFSWMSEDEAQD